MVLLHSEEGKDFPFPAVGVDRDRYYLALRLLEDVLNHLGKFGAIIEDFCKI